MYRILIRNLAVIILIGLAAPPLFAQQQLTSIEPLVSDANLVQLQKNIELNITNLSLEDALVSIAEKANLKLMYSKALIPKEERITLNKKSISLYDALWAVLDGSDLRFAISENQLLVLMKNSEEEKMLSEKVIIQETVTGQVTDAASGEALPGVNVMIKGTTTGASTGAEGQFEMTVPSLQDTLVFSYIGYENQEVPINGRSEIGLQLVTQSVIGEEMIVTAFGVERQSRQLSYSVQEIEGASLSAVGNDNIVNSLQGKIAGVTVRQSSGAPGASHEITIRGTRSLTGSNAPLYVIDGLPIAGGGRAMDINPGDIESLNVLKGPTASALYGLRAANGVIVIETKKGRGTPEGGPSISFQTSYNFEQNSMFPDVQSTYMQGEDGVLNLNSTHSWGPRVDEVGTYTNQLGEEEVAAVFDNAENYFQTGGTSNSNLSISNALDRGNYAISLGYTDQTGIMESTGMQRLNMKLAGGYDLSENLRVNTSVNLSNTQVAEQPAGTGSDWWSAFAVPRSYDLMGKPTHVPGNPYQQINFRGGA